MEFLIVFENLNHIWKCHIHVLTAIESRLAQQQISFKTKDSPKHKENDQGGLPIERYFLNSNLDILCNFLSIVRYFWCCIKWMGKSKDIVSKISKGEKMYARKLKHAMCVVFLFCFLWFVFCLVGFLMLFVCSFQDKAWILINN